MTRDDVSAHTPVEPDTLRIEAPATAAAGLPSVLSTFRHIRAETGVMRGAKALLQMNQRGGFDCPGCAWPEPDEHRSTFEFCENGAKALAEEATLKRVTPAFFARHSVAELSRQSDHWLTRQGRLTEPVYLAPGADHYRPLSWDDAFALIARHLKALPTPEQALFYTSGRTSNEAAFLYQLLVRRFGTNNFPDCSNMCHESTSVALKEVIGTGTGTVSLADFDAADLILVLGQNPGSNHPRMLASLQQAARNGCHIVSINPLRETGLQRFKHPQGPQLIIGPGTEIAKTFLQVRLNGDLALLKGVMKAVLEYAEANAGAGIDRRFIEAKTSGFAAFSADLAQCDWAELEAQSGIGVAAMRELGERYCRSQRVICCWAMGMTQQPNGVANVQAIINLLLLGGHFGRPGAGACPVRGHSNVQGDRTMGIDHHAPAWIDRLEQHFGFSAPRAAGCDTVAAIKAMSSGAAKVFIALGGNFLSAAPDTDLVAECLRGLDLSVQISTKLNRSHLVTGREALILPCLGRSEQDLQRSGAQFITTENSMSVINRSEGRLAPAAPGLRSEVAIVAGLGEALFGNDAGIDWRARADDYRLIRADIAAVVPGFADYDRRAEQGGFTLPHGVRDACRFDTASGRALFTVHTPLAHTLRAGEYLMMSIRTHDQYNTTIYGLDDRYRGIHNGRRVVLMNVEDIAAAGFTDGDWVDLHSHFAGQVRRAPHFRLVGYDIPRGCLATYYPETNVLVALDNNDSRSHTPASKWITVTLQASAGADVGAEEKHS